MTPSEVVIENGDINYIFTIEYQIAAENAILDSLSDEELEERFQQKFK